MDNAKCECGNSNVGFFAEDITDLGGSYAKYQPIYVCEDCKPKMVKRNKVRSLLTAAWFAMPYVPLDEHEIVLSFTSGNGITLRLSEKAEI